MQAYFLSVILVALFGGICEELLPESGGLRPHVKLVTGLCVLTVLVLPAKDLITGIGDFFVTLDYEGLIPSEEAEEDFEALFRDSLSRHAEEEAGELLTNRLTSAFGLKAGTCRAEVYLGEGGEAERVLVCLTGVSVFESPYEIEAYVNSLLSCPCDVAVGQ